MCFKNICNLNRQIMMKNPMLLVINMLIIDLTWAALTSQETKDVPPFISGYSASRNDVGS